MDPPPREPLVEAGRVRELERLVVARAVGPGERATRREEVAGGDSRFCLISAPS